jgi:hypothetical protein
MPPDWFRWIFATKIMRAPQLLAAVPVCEPANE